MRHRYTVLKAGPMLHFPIVEGAGGRGVGHCLVPGPERIDYRKDLFPQKEMMMASPCPQCGQGRVIKGFIGPGERLEIICVSCVSRRV